MKVLFYIHSLVVGGAETIVTNYILGLKERGIETVLVVNRHENTFLEKGLNDANVKIYALDKQIPQSKIKKIFWHVKLRLTNYRKKFNKIIKAEHPDLIHVNTSIKCIKRIKFPVQKMIYSFHSNVDRSLRLAWKNERKTLYKKAMAGLNFFALTEQMRDDIKRTFNTDKIYKLPNAVDIQKIRADAYTKNEFLPQIGVPTNSFVLGHVGRFGSVKNHKRIISIFKELHKIRNDSYLVLIGGGSQKELADIRALVDSCGLSDFVKFLGVRQDATRIIGCLDAFVLPSFNESFSIALVEAQALHIRAVASDNVPTDVFCNDNCFRLSLEKSDEEWAKLLLGSNITDDTKDLNQFDINNVINMIISNYSTIIKRT